MKSQSMEMFPYKRIRPSEEAKLVKIKIYCECQQVHNKSNDAMARCDMCRQWYHQKCIRIPKDVFSKKGEKWTCNSCK